MRRARRELGSLRAVHRGATGSGKSTTLAAMVDYANRHRKDHILTVEDPTRFVLVEVYRSPQAQAPSPISALCKKSVSLASCSGMVLSFVNSVMDSITHAGQPA